MGIFGRGSGGGLMNVIRCDEEKYLVWKWRPLGQEVNTTSRENSIRYGSTLRVKDGEVAVFVYLQQNATLQDFIEGPYDQTIKTGNFPVLANLVGMAWGGESPFQAEVYFINLQSNNQIRFGVPYFDIFDPRLPDHGIPVSVRGTITFNITDYRGFIKLNRLVEFDLDNFLEQIKAAVCRYVKSVVANIPRTMNIPLVQMETQILEINQKVQGFLSSRLQDDFGVNLKALDISAIEVDKDSPYYAEVRQLTAGNTARTMNAQTDVNIQNLMDMQAINSENVAETMRIQREEAQRAQRLQSETNFLGAHSIDKQAEVLKAAAESLGQMGTMNMGNGDGGGLNPAGMMTGMMMGGAMGQQMAGMMSQMGQAVQGGLNTPPPMPNVQYFTAVNGQQAGPFTMQQLQVLVGNGQLTKQTYVWKQGMANWDFAENVPEVATLFGTNTPPPPPPPVP
ncbi:MAG: SPFH domain-containing protein [Prevotella sp.]|nr:SPFH domain-containing protein [Prevotella sp.]